MAFVFKESGRFRLVWDACILIGIVVSVILIPYQIAFQHIIFGLGSETVYLLDLLFLVDIALNFFTSYRHGGKEVTQRHLTVRHYLRTFFVVDLLANLPLDSLLLAHPDVMVSGVSLVLILRGLRLLRIVRLYVIVRRWELQGLLNPGILRIGKFVGTVMILIHWIACAWFLTAFVDRFPADSWAVNEGIENAVPGVQYVRSLYWAITTMTTVGYGDITPGRTVEYVLAMFVMLLGASMYAFIIGNIASLFSNLDSAKAAHWNRIESVAQYLHYRHTPSELSEKVRNYYEYLWATHRGLKEEAFLDDLPGPLRLEVLLHLTRDLLENVPLFKYSSPTLRNVLLDALNPQTYAPQGYIIQEGEVGNEIFFISNGQVEITSDGGEKHHGILQAGDYFGDLALILNERRSASVKTLTYCEVFVLNGVDFNRIKASYTEFREVLTKMSSDRSEKLEALILDGVIL